MRTALSALALLFGSVSGQDQVLHQFEKRQLSKEFFCEGATAGDLNRDGHVDVVAGPHWFEGPSFETKHELYRPIPFNIKRYSENFFAWVEDFNGDEWPDVLVVTFPGKESYWLENPRGEERHWNKHVIFSSVDNESPVFIDLDGDGRRELVCQTGGQMGWASPDWNAPSRPWKFHSISKAGIGGRFTHGLGVGDVDGDGRLDVLWKNGWWKQPRKMGSGARWEHHAHKFAGRGGAQMYAFDVDGDGDNDVVTADNAHGYGLYWFEASLSEDGAVAFKRHRIMGAKPRESDYGVAFGNLHAMDVVDMNGDGLLDLVTGNRYFAHSGGDAADRELPGLYWFELRRSETGAEFIPHRIDGNSGVGTQVVARDITGNGLQDVIVGNKMGAFVHLHAGRLVSVAQWKKSQPKKVDHESVRKAVEESRGVKARNREGRVLNLDFETGNLQDWKSTGTAFDGMPNSGDTVQPRRSDSVSGHEGEFWIGTFEKLGTDRAKGTLTCQPFVVAHPFASFLVGGGRKRGTRVELVRADTGAIVHFETGRNAEEMERVGVDLREHVGSEMFIRIIDNLSSGWGHINFDHFRLHAAKPRVAFRTAPEALEEQTEAYSAEDAASRMTVPDGFHVKAIASEPDLHQPIALAIDDRGRLWVAEAYTYPNRAPEGQGRDRIVVLEDANGDGDFETRTVFTEGLNLVSGLEVGFGGVWVGAAPYLLFIPDRDGDLKPDGEPEVLLDGWGFHDTHETLNAFNWGPDGWLYGCHGVFTHSKVGRVGAPEAERTPVNAAVWRYHPTRHEFEVFAWGASNQWGVDFDDHGQAIITACVIPHLYHVVQGGRYQRQSGRHFKRFVYDDIKTIADHRHYVGKTPHGGNGVSGAAGGGHAHCGAMVYLGDNFPDRYRNVVFMANIHGNRLNNDLLRRSGSGFVGEHGKDFLLANDQWFRGINFRAGPDGGVYLIDWYDRQACHRTNPEIWDRTNGRLYKVVYGAPAPQKVNLSTMSSEALVALHLRKNEWHVRMARRLLMERGESEDVYRELRQIMNGNPDVTRRLRALWTLHATGGLQETTVLRLLKDPEESIRAWAIQLSLERRDATPELLKSLGALGRTEQSARVRLYLASALQRISHANRKQLLEALSSRSEDADDQNIPLMVWYGMAPMVRSNPEWALKIAFASPFPQLRGFVVRWLAEARTPRLDLIVEAASKAPNNVIELAILQQLNRALSKRANLNAPTSWPPYYRKLIGGRDSLLRDLANQLAVTFGDKGALPELRRLALDSSNKRATRASALRGCQKLGDPELSGVLRELVRSGSLRLLAVRMMASDAGEGNAQFLLKHYLTFSAREKQAAAATLCGRAESAADLLGAIIAGRLRSDVLGNATLRRQIASLGSDQVDALMLKAWGRARRQSAAAVKAIDDWVAKLKPAVLSKANIPHGRALFARTCASCHELFETGGEIGPGLTGSNRSNPRYLLENILDPSAEVARDYQVSILGIENGRLVTGIVVDENRETLTLQMAEERIVIAHSAIDEAPEGGPDRRLSRLSIMPEGQLDGLSFEDVRDLIAYLGSPTQSLIEADDHSILSFFNGVDLKGWTGDPSVWSVVNGEIVGRTNSGLKKNSFLSSDVLLTDFRLIVDVQLEGDLGNSGIQVRSVRQPDTMMKGYQADIGKGWWGKLYEEHGRGLLESKSGESLIRPGDWNTYEIMMKGDRIQTKLNGHLIVDRTDAKGAKLGVVGLQVHSGGPTVVRFRNFRLTLSP